MSRGQGSGVSSSVRRAGKRSASRLGYLVPKLSLGTPLLAKLSLATIFVPKYNLGTSGLTLILMTDYWLNSWTDPIKEFPIRRYRKGQDRRNHRRGGGGGAPGNPSGGRAVSGLDAPAGLGEGTGPGVFVYRGHRPGPGRGHHHSLLRHRHRPDAAPQRGGRDADRGRPGPAGPPPPGGVLFQLRPVRQGGGERDLPEGAAGAERRSPSPRRRCCP